MPSMRPLDARGLYAWAFMLTVLVVFSDFPQTTDLAAAFAWLIFIAVFLRYGVSVFEPIAKAIGPTGKA